MPPDPNSGQIKFSDQSGKDATSERSDRKQTASRKVTTVACAGCQRRKSKCDGQRPSCSACRTRGASCVYEIADGLTRSADLKQKNQVLTARLLELEQLLDCLRSESDQSASKALARLRLGDNVGDIVAGCGRSMPYAQLQRHFQQQYELASAWNSDAEDRGQPWSNTSLSDSWLDGEARSSENMALDPCHMSAQHTWLQPLFELSTSDEQVPTAKNGRDGEWAGSSHKSNSKAASKYTLWPEQSFEQIRLTRSVAASAENNPVGRRHWNNQGYANAESLDIESGSQTIEVVGSVFMAQNPGSMDFGGSGDPLNIWRANLALTRSIPLWAILPKRSVRMLEKTADNAYSQFLKIHADSVARGSSAASVIGESPLIECLFGAQHFASANELSKWAAGTASSLFEPGIEQLVTFLTSWHLMRWMLAPSPENYAAVIPSMRPTPDQCFTAHDISTDFLPTRKMRYSVIEAAEAAKDAANFKELMIGLRFTWQHSIANALCKDAESGALGLSPVFIEHMKRMDNWTTGSQFQHLMGDGAIDGEGTPKQDASIVVPDGRG